METVDSIIERFLLKIRPDISGCWLWEGAKNRGGYGRFNWGKKNCSCHRLSYMLFKGTIPEGLLVRHKCDVRDCVNPEHLEVGTHEDNMEDCFIRGRRSSKLSAEEVLTIRELVSSGLNDAEVGRAFGVTKANIRAIRIRKSWKEL